VLMEIGGIGIDIQLCRARIGVFGGNRKTVKGKHRWNCKEATPFGLSFSAVLLCFLFLALLNVMALYPFCLNAFLKCGILSLKHSVSYIVLPFLMSGQHCVFL
jgi:hypothetical protein